MSDGLLVIRESAQMNATPERVYAVISDYRLGHPRILPKQFHSLSVEQGGVGAGTIIRFQVNAFGQRKELRAVISEPEPGRILLEKDLDTGTETTFTVVPAGSGSEVTISTKMKMRSGFLGKIQHFVTIRFLRSVYRKELKNLSLVAADSLQG
jgi:Polyketide cyclase / dehydrase and lipid transport